MVASLAVLFLVLSGPQQAGKNLTEKVSFSVPAARLENLLPELGKAVGVPMEAETATKDEVVLVRVKDMPLQTLMAKIAEVSGAEWEEKQGVYRLGRSIDLLRKQERAEQDRVDQREGARRAADGEGKRNGRASGKAAVAP